MNEKRLKSKDIGAFVVYPFWSMKGATVEISLSLSHKRTDIEYQPLKAEAIRASVLDVHGEAWRCIEAPREELVATTGPGITSYARFVFAEPYHGATPRTLNVSIDDAEGSFVLEPE